MASKLWRPPTIVPALAYEDVPATVEFLTRAFGFRERAGARLTGDGFVLAWMEVGDGLISLATAGGHGAIIISEPDDKFWGGRVYEAKDIDGHYWEFSERDRELDSTAWKLPPSIKMGA